MKILLFIVVFAAVGWVLVRLAASTRSVVAANRQRANRLRRAEHSETAAPEVQIQVLQAVHQADQVAARALPEDYTLTGAILAGLGVAAMYGGRAAAYGDWAVGSYTAGMITIVVGIGLAILGGVLRMLAKPLIESDISQGPA